MSDSAIINSSRSADHSFNSTNLAVSAQPAAQPAALKKTLHWVIVLIVVPWILAGLTLWVGRMLVERGG